MYCQNWSEYTLHLLLDFFVRFFAITVNLAKKQELLTKNSYFYGKWKRYFPVVLHPGNLNPDPTISDINNLHTQMFLHAQPFYYS